jgi:soluble lytic murein transglycosylase
VNRRRWIALAALVLLDLGVLLLWSYRRDHRFDDLFQSAALAYGLPPALVKAVAWQESRFNPDARGGAGELGLMQVTEDAALEWATAARVPKFSRLQLLDPRTNTLAGAYYLAKVMRRYTNADNALPYALADYNAGRGNVLRWINTDRSAATNSAAFVAAVGFPSTRAYIQAVTERYAHYRGRFP